jgi:membrane-associated phospholipid phosphatase
MPAPLVSARWRAPALVVAILCAVATLSFGIALHDGMHTAFDEWAFRAADGNLEPHVDHLLYLAEPGASFAVIAAVAVAGALARRWALVALAAVGPATAVVLTEYVLKPLVHRVMTVPGIDPEVLREYAHGAYPSGHETGVASAAVLVLIAAGQARLPRVFRVATGVVLATWVALAAFALIRNGYHYATDTFGAIGLSYAVVAGTALAIDATRRRVRPREPQLT